LFTILIAREGIDTSAENFGGFALVESEFLAHAGDVARIDDGCIHLLGEGAHFAHGAIRFRRVQDELRAGRAEVASHRHDEGGFALVGVGLVAGIVDQFRRRRKQDISRS
jgi:hypothetical protein